MDYKDQLEVAKQYLRDRKKYVVEQSPLDPNRFQPRSAFATDIRLTIKDYQHDAIKKQETTTQTVRFLDRKVRNKK